MYDNCNTLGTTFPALSSLLAAWIPLKERSKLGSLVFGGGQVSANIQSYCFIVDEKKQSYFVLSATRKYY